MKAIDIQQAVIDAADASDLSGYQKNRIKRIMKSPFRPIARRNITDRVTEALLAEEMIVVTEAGVEAAVDWTKVLEFIKTLLPIVLQLIALFA